MNRYQFSEEQHLHTLDGRPLTGTSSVIDVLAKPLTWWASGLACAEFGWLNPKQHTEQERKEEAALALEQVKSLGVEEYQKLLDKAYRAHASNLKKSATKGTNLHEELEHWVKAQMGLVPKRDYDPKINGFVEWSRTNVKEFLWSEAHCWSETLWVGGISDAGAILKDDSVAVIDFKSSKEAYASQFIQIGGYALQVEENGVWSKNGSKSKEVDKISSLIVVPFGASAVLPVIMRDVEAYKEGFKSALKLYRLIYNHSE